MKERKYIQNEVAKILAMPSRRILSWTEKGLIAPFQESTGPGSKRQYSYCNLIEFILCDFLLEMKHYSFQHVKNLMNDLRRTGLLESWVLKEKSGTLVIYNTREYVDISIIPLEKEDVVNFSKTERKKIIESVSVDLIDLKIFKEFVDRKIA